MPVISPNNPAGEPEDIFAETAPTPSPKPPTMSAPQSPTLTVAPAIAPEIPEVPEAGWFSRNKWLLIPLILVIIIVASGGSFYLWQRTKNQQPATNINLNINIPLPTNTNTAGGNTNVSLDLDRDGLTEDEERQYNTNPRSRDTDLDGLSDREEVKVYLIDPKDSDTDNDTYLDGEEVRSLHNPKGPGKLFELQEEIEKLRNLNINQ